MIKSFAVPVAASAALLGALLVIPGTALADVGGLAGTGHKNHVPWIERGNSSLRVCEAPVNGEMDVFYLHLPQSAQVFPVLGIICA